MPILIAAWLAGGILYQQKLCLSCLPAFCNQLYKDFQMLQLSLSFFAQLLAVVLNSLWALRKNAWTKVFDDFENNLQAPFLRWKTDWEWGLFTSFPQVSDSEVNGCSSSYSLNSWCDCDSFLFTVPLLSIFKTSLILLADEGLILW